MQIIDLLTPERTLYAQNISSKKRALEILSQLFAQQLNADSNELFDAFIEREKLGATSIGHGIAIPHIRSNHVTQPQGALLRLATPLDFNALDKQPVDILFGLIVPAHTVNEHLQILATLAEAFNNETFRKQLRMTTDSQILYQLATGNIHKHFTTYNHWTHH